MLSNCGHKNMAVWKGSLSSCLLYKCNFDTWSPLLTVLTWDSISVWIGWWLTKRVEEILIATDLKMRTNLIPMFDIQPILIPLLTVSGGGSSSGQTDVDMLEKQELTSVTGLVTNSISFCFHFAKNLICLEGKSMTLYWGNTFSLPFLPSTPSLLPSRTLEGLFVLTQGASGALNLPNALLLEL